MTRYTAPAFRQVNITTIADRVANGLGKVTLFYIHMIGIKLQEDVVGANALVTGGKVVPPNALALGVPATFREDANTVEANLENAAIYVERVAQYRSSMRRLDDAADT